jgi:N-acetylmuramic acid 6-phosphate (MurNAc-6-P) etherase
MKIFTNKKWEEYNNQFIDIQIENKDLKEDNANYVSQVETIVDINKELSYALANTEEQLKNAKKMIRKLKMLCTKNGIRYEEGKKCKKK